MADHDVMAAKRQYHDEGEMNLDNLKDTYRSMTHLTQVLSGKASDDTMKSLASKLQVELTPDIANLGTNQDISNALVEKAVKNGRDIKDMDKQLVSLNSEADLKSKQDQIQIIDAQL